MNKEVKTRLNFGNTHIVLLLKDRKTFANNVIAYDNQGQEMWKINDIIKAEDPCGNSVINKKNDDILVVISTIGMMYEIDINKLRIIKSIPCR